MAEGASPTGNRPAGRGSSAEGGREAADALSCPIDDGEPTPDGSTPDFVDVSHHDKDIDWAKYAGSGRELAVCKATESTVWSDPTMADHRAALGRLGLYCGLYHFAGASVSNHIGDAIAEADYFCETVGALESKEFPVLDFELPYKLTPEQQVKWIGRWCKEVQAKTGKTPWVYTDSHMLRKMDASSLTKYPLWLANYQSSDPKNPPSSGSWPTLTAWQYTYKARVPGLGPCDDSYLYGDLPTLVGTPPPPPPPSPPPPSPPSPAPPPPPPPSPPPPSPAPPPPSRSLR
jgi:GH25 family lysozyme M1 (1,4-beta-N-acetylmuramidase)